MIFNVLLYASIGISLVGLIYKISTWFTRKIGISADNITASARFLAVFKGVCRAVFSPKILILIKVFFFDVMIQKRILQEDLLRWLMHILIFYGFMVLLLMHALEYHISSLLFSEYYSTLNPFLFIRNLAAVLVFFGIALAIYRRFIRKVPRIRTNVMDKYVIIIVAVIMVSGIMLEGSKIASYSEFQDMVDEYGDLDDEEEIRALESLWVSDFGVVSPNVNAPFDPEILAQGMEIHEMSCVDCHSSPKWAFAGYTASRVMSPISLALDKIRGSEILWYIHIIACFFGLAYLPFSKMFHIIVSPLSLLANAVMDSESSDPANIATRQVMELDACTHCGACSIRCSVGITSELLQNINILPSEKIAGIKALVSGKSISDQEMINLQEGLCLCINCRRCTDVCPVGINLQDLWFNVREELLQKGYPEFLILSPFSYYRGLKRDALTQDQFQKPLEIAGNVFKKQSDSLDSVEVLEAPTPSGELARKSLVSSIQAYTFSTCFSCTTCSSVCPVASNYDNDSDILGLMPHQIMHAAILGISEKIFSSAMLWSCLGCYECQQHCPQGVHVADVFYELKNLAIAQAKAKGIAK